MAATSARPRALVMNLTRGESVGRLICKRRYEWQDRYHPKTRKAWSEFHKRGYILFSCVTKHIRPQVSGNWASRPLCHT